MRNGSASPPRWASPSSAAGISQPGFGIHGCHHEGATGYRSGHWLLTPEKQEAALEYIAKAEHYGWDHEAWKLNWIVLCRGTGDKMQYFCS